MDSLRLDDTVAVITGAGSGIGRVAALMFAEAGAHVCVLDIDADAARATVDRVTEAGGAGAYTVDVTDRAAVDDTIGRVLADHGRIDVLYNNAGGSSGGDGPVHEVDPEVFKLTLRVDLGGTFLVSRAVIPAMLAAGSGCIVNTASTAGLVGGTGRNAYSAAKGGVIALTRSMAIDYGASGIRVNAVAPGITLTERIRGALATGAGGDLEQRHVLGYGEPEDVARAALFLASPAAARITGVILPVDSGWTAG